MKSHKDTTLTRGQVARLIAGIERMAAERALTRGRDDRRRIQTEWASDAYWTRLEAAGVVPR